MNNVVFNGRLCTIPKIRIFQIDGNSVSMCVFTIAVADGIFDAKESEGIYSDGNVDFFECVAFNDAAQMINSNFVKGSKIICRGKLKNHYFEDTNRTRHFTQVFVAEQVEFGDTEAVFSKYAGKKKPMELSVLSDMREIHEVYKKICDRGFVCVDEDDYYRIAMANT